MQAASGIHNKNYTCTYWVSDWSLYAYAVLTTHHLKGNGIPLLRRGPTVYCVMRQRTTAEWRIGTQRCASSAEKIPGIAGPPIRSSLAPLASSSAIVDCITLAIV